MRCSSPPPFPSPLHWLAKAFPQLCGPEQLAAFSLLLAQERLANVSPALWSQPI